LKCNQFSSKNKNSTNRKTLYKIPSHIHNNTTTHTKYVHPVRGAKKVWKKGNVEVEEEENNCLKREGVS